MSEAIEKIFSRNPPGLRDILRHEVVGVAGCGGLGSNAALSLVRAGIGKLILADYDTVEMSNLNRQQYDMTHIGRKKVHVLSELCRKINPHIDVVAHDIKLTPNNIRDIFQEASILVEAFDNAESKKWLAEAWSTAFPDRPLVMGSGLGGYGHLDELRVQRTGNIYVCGDGKRSSEEGLCPPRVIITANMEASTVIDIFLSRGEYYDRG